MLRTSIQFYIRLDIIRCGVSAFNGSVMFNAGLVIVAICCIRSQHYMIALWILCLPVCVHCVLLGSLFLLLLLEFSFHRFPTGVHAGCLNTTTCNNISEGERERKRARFHTAGIAISLQISSYIEQAFNWNCAFDWMRFASCSTCVHCTMQCGDV